jgi:putative tricarboxylic transport membrane protein
MDKLLTGLEMFLQINTLLYLCLGSVIGWIIGVLPGLTVTLGVALALPITLFLQPLEALALLIGIYQSGVFAGSITAILLNIPGTPAAAATALEGNLLSNKGEAALAVNVALVSSLIGGTAGALALMFIAPYIAKVAIEFGFFEISSLMIFALASVVLISGDSITKSLIAACIGFALSTLGLDPLSGIVRLSFNIPRLMAGISLLPMLIGLFGLPEIFIQFTSNAKISTSSNKLRFTSIFLTIKYNIKYYITTIRSIIIGLLIGALPGSGTGIASFISLSEARRSSKEPEKFGKGAIEGVIASETANNTVCGSALIPLLTLGIPGDSITAVMLGALMVHGLRPGPMLFTKQGEYVYGIYILLFFSVIALFFLSYILLPFTLKILRIQSEILYPILIVFCVLGAYLINRQIFDLYIMLSIGLLGYFLRKLNFPLTSLLLAFILGPRLEMSFRQALFVSRNSFIPFITKPLSLLFLLLTLVIIIFILRRKLIERRIK